MKKFQWMLALVAACALTAGAIAGDAKDGKKAKKAAPINDVCPMSGKGVDKAKTTEVEVAFCCGNCLGKFNKNPGAYLEKVAKAPADKCPMSGKGVNAKKTATVTVGFCCGNCKGKFDKAPRKGLAKVKAKKAEKKKDKS